MHIMKFKKGGKLRRVSKKMVPSGSQRSMEAIRGNCPNYTVRYVESKGANNHGVVERVSQRVIRPCHPRLEVSEAWAPGDVVEVFDNFSWKMATVSEILGKAYILVRLLGSSQEFKVRKSDIRARQSSEDDAWAMVGRGNNNCNGGELHLILNHNKNSICQVQKTNSKTKLQKKDDCFAIGDQSFQDIQNTKVRILQGSTNCSSEAFYGAGHKVRVIEKEGRYLRVVAANPSELPAYIEAVTYPRDSMGESHRPASVNHRLGGRLEMDVKGKKPTSTVQELNDVDSVTCSVGSCSVSVGNSCELPCDVSAGVAERISGHFCDNGSPCHLGYEGHCPPTKEELAAEIHRLELHAYRCTIEALHASGPLSWEQEVLITNLRLSLNISNDEHLMQLKHLISANASIPI